MTRPITLETATPILAQFAPLYTKRAPVYQVEMLNRLQELWAGPHATLLDVGGGTGLMAHAMQNLLPVGKVTAVDVVDRYFEGLSVDTQVYDGTRLPFADGSFCAATINNVMHHIPVESRYMVIREIRRVVAGPVYIKDHLPASKIDHAKLAILDFLGNIPFGGMVKADYLERSEWDALAHAGRYRIAAEISGQYRSGPMAMLFPNRLEITMRLDPA
jgi:ubiquinone/menaquinone biosynthesis C-methylase UbiE